MMIYEDKIIVTLDIGLGNKELYNGCEITTVGGRLTLVTPPDIAKEIVGKNAETLALTNVPQQERDAITLTGAMAVWSYLIVFHVIVHKYRQVWYCDGRSEPILIAQH